MEIEDLYLLQYFYLILIINYNIIIYNCSTIIIAYYYAYYCAIEICNCLSSEPLSVGQSLIQKLLIFFHII